MFSNVLVFLSKKKSESSGFSTALSELSSILRKTYRVSLLHIHKRDAKKPLLKTVHAEGIKPDLLIVIGGDGTILEAAQTSSMLDVPLMGINLGRLGFLADFSIDQLSENIKTVFSGDCVYEERTMLHCEVYRDDVILQESHALNDFVIHKWNTPALLEFSTHIQKEVVHVQRADGIILSTPTGSTAYALSGGGPIITPLLPAFLIVPICPHSLNQRPLVIDDSHEITIKILTHGKNCAHVTGDGQSLRNLSHKDIIHIQKSSLTTKLIRPKEHSHFNLLKNKIHWGRELC